MSRSIPTSVVDLLLQKIPEWRPQLYFKSSLIALSHAIEDLVLAGMDEKAPLVIASFQKERFYKQEAHRYERIAKKSDRVFVLASPETDFKSGTNLYEKVAFAPDDGLVEEWHLVVIGEKYSSCLICREKKSTGENTIADNSRRFEGIWTFDREVTKKAAEILLERILVYRPELAEKIAKTKKIYLAEEASASKIISFENNPDPFVQRLIAYLQAGQYKLLKANKFLADKEHRERIINSIITAIARSLNPESILEIAVQKIGEELGVCRCIVYRCKANDAEATIEHEFLNSNKIDLSLLHEKWPLKKNPLFQEVVELREVLSINDTTKEPRLQGEEESLAKIVKKCSILSWLLIPILYQGKLLGMMELHHCTPAPLKWKERDIALVDAIATQVGVALIQAEAYAHLEELNQQLEALDRTRSNLVAITGHELRTPLSTIQVCLESLAQEPDMSPELRQVMLNTALKDAERMRKLVQDFLTLSRLESGTIQWHPEPVSIFECVNLAISNVRARNRDREIPQINDRIPEEIPLALADGEWLTEVITKLIDNSCKFTSSAGKVVIEVEAQNKTNPSRNIDRDLLITVTDNGKGIEPDRLEKVFDRFYQEEGALRRSVGGTGLGLAICRQIVNGWGGTIWAESSGKNSGSKFYFTVPVFQEIIETKKSYSNGKLPPTPINSNGHKPTTGKKRKKTKS
ncbi:MAG: DICT sensory domain-containing protein [Prochloraceae cyanobacterium]